MKKIFLIVSIFFLTIGIAAQPSQASYSLDEIRSVYEEYTVYRSELLNDLHNNQHLYLGDVKDVFREFDSAIVSMESFLAAYVMYKTSLMQSAQSHGTLTDALSDLLDGKAVSTSGISIIMPLSQVPFDGTVLSSEAANEKMIDAAKNLLEIREKFVDELRRLNGDLVRQGSPATRVLANYINRIDRMYYLLEGLRLSLQSKVDLITQEIGRATNESTKVLFIIQIAQRKIIEAKRNIAEAKQLMRELAKK